VRKVRCGRPPSKVQLLAQVLRDTMPGFSRRADSSARGWYATGSISGENIRIAVARPGWVAIPRQMFQEILRLECPLYSKSD